MNAEFDVHNKDASNLAMACHLGQLTIFCGIPGFIVPLIVWLVKRDEYPEVDIHGKEALNFQITLFLLGIVSVLLVMVLIGVPMLIVLYFYGIIMPIVAGVAASKGKVYRYPMTLRLIK